MNPPATKRSLKPVQSKRFIYQVEVLLSSYKDIKSTPVCFSAYNSAEVRDDLGYYRLAMSWCRSNKAFILEDCYTRPPIKPLLSFFHCSPDGLGLIFTMQAFILAHCRMYYLSFYVHMLLEQNSNPVKQQMFWALEKSLSGSIKLWCYSAETYCKRIHQNIKLIHDPFALVLFKRN